jgi:hypothetical protein
LRIVPVRGRSFFPGILGLRIVSDILGLRIVSVDWQANFPDILGLLRIVPVDILVGGQADFPDILGLLRIVPDDGRYYQKPYDYSPYLWFRYSTA